MKHTHPDIANKKFECISFHFAGLIEDFARVCKMNPDTLLTVIENTISTHHHKSTPSAIPGHPPSVRYLEVENVGIYYQVLPDVIEIGELVSLNDGPYENAYRLINEFTLK